MRFHALCSLKERVSPKTFMHRVAVFLCSFMCATLSLPAYGASIQYLSLAKVFPRGGTYSISFKVQGADKVKFDINAFLFTKVRVKDSLAEFVIDTSGLKVGNYYVRAILMKGAKNFSTHTFPIKIGKVHDHERLPVWRWGGSYEDMDDWIEKGFNGNFFSAVRDVPNQKLIRHRAYMLNMAAERDFEVGIYLHPLISKRWDREKEVQCIGPDSKQTGKPYPLEPAVLAHASSVAKAAIQGWAQMPALRHALLCSEYRTPYNLSPLARKLAKEAGVYITYFVAPRGKDRGRFGIRRVGKQEVKNGLIEDDSPRYQFMRWWWSEGNGLSTLNEIMAKIIKKKRPDLIIWNDPYRMAPVRGTHKGLDMIATWTYGHPDIKRLIYTTYLQAVARPYKQLVQQDITLYVYGRYAMPIKDSTAKMEYDFSGKDPHFNASPDYAREATWLVVSQRPDVLCYYTPARHAKSMPGVDPKVYSPETFDALHEVFSRLVQPYGPAILDSDRVKPKVALLMSAAALWYGRSEYLPGYPNEQTLPYATLLMMNHVPFDVLLEDDIKEGMLNNYEVLVLPKAGALMKSIYRQIRAFISTGGTLIANKPFPANLQGASLTNFSFAHQRRIDGTKFLKVTADQDREIMEGYAKKLAQYIRQGWKLTDSDSQRVLTNSLNGGNVRYHFFINDDRTYGSRFGKWKLRFEKGIEQKATMSIRLDGAAVLYDVLEKRMVDFETKDGGWANFDLRLPAASGKLIAALPEKIAKVYIGAPSVAILGKPVTIKIGIYGVSGKPMKGSFPLRLDVLDAKGVETDWCRYTCTLRKANGMCTFTFTPALNGASGIWTVRVTDLIAGKVSEVRINISKLQPTFRQLHWTT